MTSYRIFKPLPIQGGNGLHLGIGLSMASRGINKAAEAIGILSGYRYCAVHKLAPS